MKKTQTVSSDGRLKNPFLYIMIPYYPYCGGGGA